MKYSKLSKRTYRIYVSRVQLNPRSCLGATLLVVKYCTCTVIHVRQRVSNRCIPLQARGSDVSMESHEDRSLLALQGPAAAEVLQQHMKDDLSKMYFGNFRKLDIKGIPCFLTRTGYGIVGGKVS